MKAPIGSAGINTVLAAAMLCGGIVNLQAEEFPAGAG